MPTHSLSVNLPPPPTTVAMESGSEENTLCQALTKTPTRVRLGLFLESYFQSSIFVDMKKWGPKGGRLICEEQESLSRGGRINRCVRTSRDAHSYIDSILLLTSKTNANLSLQK